MYGWVDVCVCMYAHVCMYVWNPDDIKLGSRIDTRIKIRKEGTVDIRLQFNVGCLPFIKMHDHC